MRNDCVWVKAHVFWRKLYREIKKCVCALKNCGLKIGNFAVVGLYRLARDKGSIGLDLSEGSEFFAFSEASLFSSTNWIHGSKSAVSGGCQSYKILRISAVVGLSRRLERSYPRSVSSKKSVSSASFFSELPKRYIL